MGSTRACAPGLRTPGERPDEGEPRCAPHPDPSTYAAKFTGRYVHRTVTGGIGHNLPQEAPEQFVEAIFDVDRFAS